MAEIRSYFPAWRVYIFGVDVTEDLTTCVISHTGSESRAPSTAEIELVNGGTRGLLTSTDTRPGYTDDRYIITERDIAVLYGIEDKLPEIRFPTVKEVLGELRESTPAEPTKRAVVAEYSEVDAVTLPDLGETILILFGEETFNEQIGSAYGAGVSTQQAETLLTINRAAAIENRYGSVLQGRLEALKRITTATEVREKRAENVLKNRVASRQNTLDRIVLDRIRARITDPVKRAVLQAKFNVRQQLRDRNGQPLQPNLEGTFKLSAINQFEQLTGQALRYPFQVGDSIFHTNDQIRIFWRDPVNPEAWYHMFAGFVTDYVDSVDADNQRIVRIRAEDPTRILRYARLTSNPGIINFDDIQTATDASTRTFTVDAFANLSLVEFLNTVIFGTESARTEDEAGSTPGRIRQAELPSNTRIGVNGSSTGPLVQDAVGAFNRERSFVAVFGPDDTANTSLEIGVLQENFAAMRVQSLGEYQALLDHRVMLSDLSNLGLNTPDAQQEIVALAQRLPVRRGQVPAEELVKVIGENPHLFPVDYGRLIFLAPGSLGPGTNLDLLLKELITINVQTSWRTRLSLIYDVVERLDFQFYASPRGDILCEMPLYDFQPDDFGDDVIDLGETDFGNVRYAFTGADRERGPYAPHLRVARRDTQSWERAFIDNNVRTQMLGTRNLAEGRPSIGTGLDVGQIEVVNLYGLFPQFGVRAETLDPLGIISNDVAARLYANVRLNQINAEARTANVEILPRVQLVFPNRPLEFEERKFVATLRSVNHDLSWGLSGDMTTSMDLKSIRGWSGQVTGSDNRPVYEPIGGFASMGFNYALRFGFIPNDVTSTREDDTP